MKAWGTIRVDWRGPAALWVALAWFLAVLWPPLPLTLFFWPSNNTGLETIRDPRAIAMVLGAVAVTAILMLINRERKREGAPRTRLGVIVRFVAYGFVATVLATAAAVAVLASLALFAPGDMFRRVGEAKATLVMGIVVMPLALLVGVSYALWSGAIASIVAFGPRAPSGRPRHMMMDALAPEVPAPVSTFAAEPAAPPTPVGPKPETDLEAALRPDSD